MKIVDTGHSSKIKHLVTYSSDQWVLLLTTIFTLFQQKYLVLYLPIFLFNLSLEYSLSN